jgi:hypothetical protein
VGEGEVVRDGGGERWVDVVLCSAGHQYG